jgi:hypothetical protein
MSALSIVAADYGNMDIVPDLMNLNLSSFLREELNFENGRNGR